MTFTKVPPSQSSLPDYGGKRPVRPTFNSTSTSDRLRESSRFPSSTSMASNSNIKKGRKSIFREIGLEDDEKTSNRSESFDIFDEKEFGEITGLRRKSTAGLGREDEDRASKVVSRWLSILSPSKRPKIQTASSAPPLRRFSVQQMSMIVLIIAVALPAISYTRSGQQAVGLAQAVPVAKVEKRANSPVDVCTRWAHQAAQLNGTLYIYGGEAKTSSDQKTNTWNNNFLALDLSKTWSVKSPALSGLAQPSGPPAVALGTLWNDYNSLFMYGGQFADNPYVQPAPVSMWKYDIGPSKWTEFQNPATSAGNFSTPSGIPVQRAAEGSGISVPELGRSWFFGGHLDVATTPGWSNQIARLYLKSLLEFTHPGFVNDAVDALHNTGASLGGAYRNITQGGIQDTAGFSQRADSVIVFVPGWGPSGIILSLGGGSTDTAQTADQYSSMDTIDVYDIQTSVWYHQKTKGTAPSTRVNACAVIFSAPDASSFNIYMYGGQNLGTDQTQYTDMWILTIPSFTWIKVDVDASSQPAGRAGHTCHARDGQMVVVGGYVGTQIPCDSPGIYNFDASTLKWVDQFTAGNHAKDVHPDNSILANSFGYQVPAPVQQVIGGSAGGGASATTPANGPATGGPFLTGKPPVFTVTQSVLAGTGSAQTGTAATATTGPAQTINPSPNVQTPDAGGAATRNPPNGGLIAAGLVAGLAGLAALYLGFCAWIYRRQVRAYQRHMAVANRYSGADDAALLGVAGAGAGGAAAAAGGMREKNSYNNYSNNNRQRYRPESSSGASEEHFAWVGAPAPAPVLGEARWMSSTSGDDITPAGSHQSSGLSRPTPTDEQRDRSSWHPDGAGGGGALSPGPGGYAGAGAAMMGGRRKSDASRSSASGGSVDRLMGGREPSFFSVVMGPRRALRVVNGMNE